MSIMTARSERIEKGFHLFGKALFLCPYTFGALVNDSHTQSLSGA